MINHYVINGWVGVVRFVVGAMLVIPCFLWIKSWWVALPRVNIDLNDIFLIILFIASALAAGWLLVRYRRGLGGSQADDDGGAKPAGSPQGHDDVSDSAERYTTVRWLSRLGAVASAVVLTALVVRDPILVINVVALGMVAIAFLLIVILVPRGL